MVPAQLQAGGGEGRGLEVCRGLWQQGGLRDGQAGRGLVGACAVLSDALVDGFIFGLDLRYGQGPVERDKESG